MDNNDKPSAENITRRKFIANTGIVLGAATFLTDPLTGFAANVHKASMPVTVGQVINTFIGEVPGGLIPDTVDTLKSGNPDTEVTGIVTTMFATIDVIRRTIDLGANFIIAHEPTFYNHADEVAWLQNSDVYQYKAELLERHNIAVWRNHDHIHSLKADGVREGLVKKLNWESYADATEPKVFNFPVAESVMSLVMHLKSRLDIQQVRFIGDEADKCSKAVLMAGASGGFKQISNLINYKPDVLICGEIAEWETAEYVRDARAKGDKLSLIVLGHIASEEPGSEFMKEWVNMHFPALKVTHVPSGNSLRFL